MWDKWFQLTLWPYLRKLKLSEMSRGSWCQYVQVSKCQCQCQNVPLLMSVSLQKEKFRNVFKFRGNIIIIFLKVLNKSLICIWRILFGAILHYVRNQCLFCLGSYRYCNVIMNCRSPKQFLPNTTSWVHQLARGRHLPGPDDLAAGYWLVYTRKLHMWV